MRIAVLQFSPQVGKVRENIARANDLLRDYAAGDFEVLVCSEMALSGMCVTMCFSFSISLFFSFFLFQRQEERKGEKRGVWIS